MRQQEEQDCLVLTATVLVLQVLRFFSRLKLPYAGQKKSWLYQSILYGYRLPYARILGGVAAIHSDLFIKVNGYSNKFFGWGGEDDDFSARCRRKGIDIVRYPQTIARYQMIKHKQDKGNEKNPARLVTHIKFFYIPSL